MKINKLHYILISILWLSVPFFCSAQIPIGTFRSHLSYYGTHSIAVSQDIVYAAAESGLVYYDKNEQKLESWSKVEGLSESDIDHLFYDEKSDYLIIAYKSANLDFVRDGRLTNVPDIKDKALTGEKTVNNFYVHDGLLYLACSFGIVTIDLSTLLIRDTWYTQTGQTRSGVNSLQIFQNQFFITTNNGIYHTPVNQNSIADFSSWQKFAELEAGDYPFSCVFNNKLYAVRHIDENTDTLLCYEQGSWHVADCPITPIRSLKASDDELMVASWNFVQTFNQNGADSCFVMSDDTYNWADVQDAAFDGKIIWIADAHNGLIRYDREWGNRELLTLDGPFESGSFRMDYSDGVMALAPGGLNSVWGNNWQATNFSYFANNQWHNILRNDNPALQNTYDITAVAVNPRNTNEFYVGTYWSGAVKCDAEKVIATYNRENSPLQSNDTAEGHIGGMRFDAHGNLWISCCHSSLPLNVLKADGSWQSFPLSSYVTGYSTVFGDILIDSRGFKWIIKPRDNTIVVLNDNGTIDNLSDDETMMVNMNAAANIETSSVNCAVEDKNGQIWIGCNLGIKVIYTPGQIFKGSVYPQNILVEQINYVQNLFEFEEVTTIAVDDANRKWVGTAKSGVFLISSDGSEQLLHFTEENSPLLSNKINHICINKETGEVFFCTTKGLISYRGTATEGSDDYSEVKVFPNPVRESYHGTIAVSGLMENSFCKIADAAGNLVWQGYANGGTLAWDGHDFYGNRPATGVYFVFASSESGKQKKVAKILFIK